MLTDTSTARSTTVTPTTVGIYCFAAVYTPTSGSSYAGSSDNTSGTADAAECVDVTTTPLPSLTVVKSSSPRSGSDVTLGTPVTYTLTLTNTGTTSEDFDLQFTGVTDTLASFGDLGQLEFLVTTSKGTITYHLDPSAPNSLDPSSSLTLSSLKSITLPIATSVAPNQRVSIPVAVELANGEGFGNAWNGQSATISYRIVASQSAPAPTRRPSTTPLGVIPPTTLPVVSHAPTTSHVPVSRASSTTPRATAPVSTSHNSAPAPVRLVTGPPQSPRSSNWEMVIGGGLLGLGIAGISVLEANRRRRSLASNP